MDKIKTNFKKDKKYEDYFDPKYTNIAIHIRRGNKRDSSFKNGLLKIQIDLYPDNFYIKLIKSIINSNKNLIRPVKIHIHSQELDLKLYEDIDEIIFHLDEDINKTFNSMVFADTLFMAPSTFSYIAGFFRDKNTIFLDYYHMCIPGWTYLLPNSKLICITEDNWYKIRDIKYEIK